MNNRRIRVALFVEKPMLERTISREDLEFLKSFADLVNEGDYPDIITEDHMKKYLPTAQACITCWGTPRFQKELLGCAPNLKVILHAAGTPKAITTEEVWRRGIRVITAAPVIAEDVAETALGGMIYWLKQFKRFDTIIRRNEWDSQYNGVSESAVNSVKPLMKRLNYLLTVGIVSASFVGRSMIKILRPFGVNILLYDPYVNTQEAKRLNVKLASLKEISERSDIVTIHAPSTEETNQMIDEKFIRGLKDGCIFVNTSRGSVVDQYALTEELKTGRIYGYLDVYENEPLEQGNELAQLDNVLLTPHISGGHTVNGGFERGNYVVNQLYTYHNLGILRNEAKKEMLDHMA